MNTIEFAVRRRAACHRFQSGTDFERDRITPFYFDTCVQKMADSSSTARCTASRSRPGRDGRK
jgi:hypothetical protein